MGPSDANQMQGSHAGIVPELDPEGKDQDQIR